MNLHNEKNLFNRYQGFFKRTITVNVIAHLKKPFDINYIALHSHEPVFFIFNSIDNLTTYLHFKGSL